MQLNPIARRRSRQITVGDVKVGGDAPITVQTMTNTLTTDVAATVAQIRAAVDAGADLVRVSCPDVDSTAALKTIVAQSTVPIIADIHFHYKRALEAAAAGAACLRINPGNIGNKDRVGEVVRAAKDHDCAIRIGVNAGSLERDILERYAEPNAQALVESALRQLELLAELDFDRVKVSVKASDIFLATQAYRALAAQTDVPLHLGITEAGGEYFGQIKSAIGLGALLLEGIGDTIRISLSADPVAEIGCGFAILKALRLRNRGVTVISCPSCARQQFDVISTVRAVEDRVAHITTPLTVSLIGCVVNGPGEAKQADFGLTGGGQNTHQLYVDGAPLRRIRVDAMDSSELVEILVAEIEAVAKQKAARTEPLPAARR